MGEGEVVEVMVAREGVGNIVVGAREPLAEEA